MATKSPKCPACKKKLLHYQADVYVCDTCNQSYTFDLKEPALGKRGSHKVTHEGKKYDSPFELSVYFRLLEDSNNVAIKHQVPFLFAPKPPKVNVCLVDKSLDSVSRVKSLQDIEHYMDFVVTRSNGEQWAVEAKANDAYADPVWKQMKKKMFIGMYLHGARLVDKYIIYYQTGDLRVEEYTRHIEIEKPTRKRLL